MWWLALLAGASVVLAQADADTSSLNASSSDCSCTQGVVPIPVDITIPVVPLEPNGTQFRLRKTFNVNGVLCEPAKSVVPSDTVQLLLHGQTYTYQYWDVSWNRFQNYSYVAHSCAQGITSFAYDQIGAGQTTRPANSTDCQIQTAGNVSDALAAGLKSGMVAQAITGTPKAFRKVVGFGHSLGSATLNYAALGAGRNSSFDALILTGHVHDPQFIIQSPVQAIPAEQAFPLEFPNGLDTGYITTTNLSARFLFYGPNNNTFDDHLLQIDELTKDIGSRWISGPGISFTYHPAHGFKGPVIELVGGSDAVHCIPDGGPCNQTALQQSEAQFWPDSKNFTMTVLPGCGHDVNLSFCAKRAFALMNQAFKSFTQ